MSTIKPPAPAVQNKVFPIFTVLGWVLILVSFIIGAAVLAPTAAHYWGGKAKSARDAAEAGSSLLGMLRSLAVTSRWLEPLTFVGVAAFMTGIALEFSTIPAILKNRGEVMNICFPLIAKLGGGQPD